MKRSYVLALALAILWLAGGLSLTPSVLARAPGYGHDRLTRLEESFVGVVQDNGILTSGLAAIAAARAAQGDMHIQLQKAHSDLRALLGQPNPEEATVMQLAETIGTLRTESQKQMLHALLAVRALLTPEQLASLREAMQHHGAGKHDQGR